MNPTKKTRWCSNGMADEVKNRWCSNGMADEVSIFLFFRAVYNYYGDK